MRATGVVDHQTQNYVSNLPGFKEVSSIYILISLQIMFVPFPISLPDCPSPIPKIKWEIFLILNDYTLELSI